MTKEELIKSIERNLTSLKIICKDSEDNEWGEIIKSSYSNDRTFFYRGCLNTPTEQLLIYKAILSTIPVEYRDNATIQFSMEGSLVQKLSISVYGEYNCTVSMYMIKTAPGRIKLRSAWDNTEIEYGFVHCFDNAKSLTEIPVIENNYTQPIVDGFEMPELPDEVIENIFKEFDSKE